MITTSKIIQQKVEFAQSVIKHIVALKISDIVQPFHKYLYLTINVITRNVITRIIITIYHVASFPIAETIPESISWLGYKKTACWDFSENFLHI